MTATVKALVEKTDSTTGTVSHLPVLTYTVGGKRYENTHLMAFSHHYEGQTMTIYCHRKYPTTYTILSYRGAAVIFLPGLFLITLGGIGGKHAGYDR